MQVISGLILELGTMLLQCFNLCDNMTLVQLRNLSKNVWTHTAIFQLALTKGQWLVIVSLGVTLGDSHLGPYTIEPSVTPFISQREREKHYISSSHLGLIGCLNPLSWPPPPGCLARQSGQYLCYHAVGQSSVGYSPSRPTSCPKANRDSPS